MSVDLAPCVSCCQNRRQPGECLCDFHQTLDGEHGRATLAKQTAQVRTARAETLDGQTDNLHRATFHMQQIIFHVRRGQGRGCPSQQPKSGKSRSCPRMIGKVPCESLSTRPRKIFQTHAACCRYPPQCRTWRLSLNRNVFIMLAQGQRESDRCHFGAVNI